MAAIYQADIWCDDCADVIKDEICSSLWLRRDTAVCPDGEACIGFDSRDDLYDYLLFMDERSYDSDEFPKHCDDYAESGYPEHCGAGEGCVNAIELQGGRKIGAWIGNSLTSYGEEYVKESVRAARLAGGYNPVTELWAEYYDYIDFGPEDFCAICGAWEVLDDYGECEDCSDSNGRARM